MSPREQAPDPYAPPRAIRSTSRGIRYAAVQLGLAWYAALGLISAPVAVLASNRWAQVEQGLAEADKAFNTVAGVFYGIRTIADVGLVIAFIAGLAWLHGAWRRTGARKRKIGASPRSVVVWTLVPVWGWWRLQGYLRELSRLNGLADDVVHVERWWWALMAHIVVRVAMDHNHIPGWLHVVDSVLQATAALLGMRMVATLERAVGRTGPSPAEARRA